MNTELLEALNILEKEKNISKDTLLEAIEQSLLQACKNHFGKADNIIVNINPETCDFKVLAQREVVDTVEDPATQISLADAKMMDSKFDLGDIERGSKVQGVRPHRCGQCQECYSPEDPRGGAQGSL